MILKSTISSQHHQAINTRRVFLSKSIIWCLVKSIKKTSINHSLNRIEYDFILIIKNYNDDNYINHFVYFQINMNFVFTHSRKNDDFSIIWEFLKTIQIKYEQIVRFIQMNDEQTLRIQYENFMKIREISTKRFVSYTSAQNDKVERFEEVLMIKTKTMRISSYLSTNLWFEVIKTMNYLNNQISKKKLAWKTLFEALIEKKSKLSHLQSYECRVYSLKNLISRKKKLKSRFFIEYLMKYDSINIF